MPSRPVPGSVSAILIAVSALLLWGNSARATGVYEDAVGHAGFLLASHRPTIRAAFIRTDHDQRDASMFVVSGTYPLRDNILIQIEQPYIALIGDSRIESGFGDTAVRARLRLAGGDGRALHALGGVRLGSGSSTYFPYASQSVDIELGVGYVDTLGIFDLWASAAGVAVKREPEGLAESARHQNFARVTAGIVVPFGQAIRLRGGVDGLVFRSGAARELFLAQVLYLPSPSLELRLSAHAEAGEPDERVSDLAVTAEILSHF